MSEIQSNQDDKEFFFREIHIDQLDSVSQSPWKADIPVNDQVVNFELEILGNIVSANGVSPDPEKIEAIVNLPAPKNIREVRSFLEMVNQLSKFTEHLADKQSHRESYLAKQILGHRVMPKKVHSEKLKNA